MLFGDRNVDDCRYHALRANVMQLLQAAAFVFMIWLVNWAITNSNERLEALSDTLHPHPRYVESIPDCSTDIFLKVKIFTKIIG